MIKSDLTRSQQMNLADALEKLRGIIRFYDKEDKVPTEDTVEKLKRRYILEKNFPIPHYLYSYN